MRVIRTPRRARSPRTRLPVTVVRSARCAHVAWHVAQQREHGPDGQLDGRCFGRNADGDTDYCLLERGKRKDFVLVSADGRCTYHGENCALDAVAVGAVINPGGDVPVPVRRCRQPGAVPQLARREGEPPPPAGGTPRTAVSTRWEYCHMLRSSRCCEGSSVCCNGRQRPAARRSSSARHAMMQQSTTRCNRVQRAATRCNGRQRPAARRSSSARHRALRPFPRARGAN